MSRPLTGATGNHRPPALLTATDEGGAMRDITITALKWVPPFAQGQVRDHRLRWVLREVGWSYSVRLLDSQDQRSADYRRIQPFGQVPVMEEAGRPALFETGAIILDVTARAGMLMPAAPEDRSLMLCWHIAALNSVEPFLMALAEVEFFLKDEASKAIRRPPALAMAERRLGEVQTALGAREWLVAEEFTVADLTMSSVLKIAGSLGVLTAFPGLSAYQARCFDRPAYRAAIAEQMDDIDRHTPADMKYRG